MKGGYLIYQRYLTVLQVSRSDPKGRSDNQFFYDHDPNMRGF